MQTSMKGWQGWVEEAYFDEDGDAMYKVMFDSKTMEKMPKELLQIAIDEGQDFQLFDFFEAHLKAAKETEEQNDSVLTYRKLKTHTHWSMLINKEFVPFATSIMMADLEEDEKTNWENFLNANVPFKAKGKGQFELKRNKKVTVKRVYGFNPNVGFTVLIQEAKGKKRPYEYPLMDLIPEEFRMLRAAELHDIWFHEMYEDENETFDPFGFL